MIKDHFTVNEIAEILEIYESSAAELLAGSIEFEPDELLELARYKGLRMDELIK